MMRIPFPPGAPRPPIFAAGRLFFISVKWLERRAGFPIVQGRAGAAVTPACAFSETKRDQQGSDAYARRLIGRRASPEHAIISDYSLIWSCLRLGRSAALGPRRPTAGDDLLKHEESALRVDPRRICRRIFLLWRRNAKFPKTGALAEGPAARAN